MAAFFPRRAEQLQVSLALIELLAPEPTRILDLGSGPGSLARLALERFPSAQVVALDFDPVLLAIGQGALGEAGGRLRWVRTNLATDEWAIALEGEAPFDAVISVATLHHFRGPRVRAIYRALAGLLRPGGVLLNAESMAAGRPGARLSRTVREARTRWAEAPESWWPAVEADPVLGPLYRERRALLDRFPSHIRYVSAEAHTRALIAAGFAEAGVGWRHLDETIVAALR
jgi:SAM-dependent methyltransferase